MCKVVSRRGGRLNAGALYVGRPTKWGNPFVVGVDGVAGECAGKYAAYLWSNATLLAALGELAGKDLECWCVPKPCHATTLLRAAAFAEANPGVIQARIASL